MENTLNSKRIGVIGAGVMGSDVAFHLASLGFCVVLKDTRIEALDKAKKKIQDDFRFNKMMNKKFINLSMSSVIENIIFTTNYSEFENLDLIIENINEEWDLKQKLYIELNTFAKANTIFAVNTSCISITKIASFLPYPENVVGAHFMNPVPLNEMVEVIRGYHTSDQTLDKIRDFLKRINKISVVVNDFPGFVSNRLSHLFMNEAAYLVHDNVASAREVDVIFKKGYGHSMGPLETADLIGLDTVVNSLNILYQSYQDSKFRCCPLLVKMVDAGLLGKKSKRGFYDYNS